MVLSETVPIDLADRSYNIVIGSCLLTDPSSYTDLPAAHTAMIVTNPTVGALYQQCLQEALAHKYLRVLVCELPDGESFKTFESLNLIFDALLSNGCDRKTVLIALGGGVIGDMTGFAAASYMRGVPFVQVPTTLLAQVDSSVGGKTAINHPLGKNMIGAFYQPAKVICDLDTLSTLPAQEFAAGLAEVIKYGPIADMHFFAWLQTNIHALLQRDGAAVAYAVKRSCEIKAQVVGVDEREAGLRAILNFGHTFGHAIEAHLGFGTWLHGEAVAAGMVLAIRLSHKLGMVDEQLVASLTSLLDAAGLPTQSPAGMSAEDYLHHMRLDKKSEAGQIQFILIQGGGKAVLQKVKDDLVRSLFD